MKNKIISKENRYLADHSWLKSYHLFSFAEYYDYTNNNFGNLRVFNDDFINAKTGFGLHPHANMEILTIVLKGGITHGDNLGNKETTYSGEVQTMTAGAGIMHSEENLGDEEVHLYQIWFSTNKIGLKPDYKNHKISLENNKLNLLASGNADDNVGFLNSDVKVFRGIFDLGDKFEYEIFDNRGLFIYITSGTIKINDESISSGDQLRFSEIGNYSFEIISDNVDFILIDVRM